MAPVVRCIFHGPSPAILEHNDARCERCMKRPLKPRMDKLERVFLVSEIPVNVARLEKQRILENSKLLQSAYLQVIPLRDQKPKANQADQMREKRSKVKEELAEIKRKRDDRMRQVCRAYSISQPFQYSPFVTHPDWVKQRQTDTTEYLHNVQAVLQSTERRDNLNSLADMRAKENKLYRTTKGAAWRVLYVRQPGNPPHYDALYDQHTGASYKECLSKMNRFIGPKAKNTIPDNCHPSYSCTPRATGAQRRNPANTYKSQKYRLQSYRHQRLHKYPINYMVKGILAMNQVLCANGVGKRNASILRHMRTTLKVRELFYHHKEELLKEFKRLLADHAINMDDPKVHRKWEKFLATGDPPNEINHLLSMTSAVSAEQKVREHDPGRPPAKPSHICPKCCESDTMSADAANSKKWKSKERRCSSG